MLLTSLGDYVCAVHVIMEYEARERGRGREGWLDGGREGRERKGKGGREGERERRAHAVPIALSVVTHCSWLTPFWGL